MRRDKSQRNRYLSEFCALARSPCWRYFARALRSEVFLGSRLKRCVTAQVSAGRDYVARWGATLHVSDGFKWAGCSNCAGEIVGNPPRSADLLGMLMPDGASVSPLTEKSGAVVVTYEPDGYVSDKDAEKYVVIEGIVRLRPKI